MIYCLALGPAEVPSCGTKFEDFELDPGRYELRRAGRSIKLEKIPMELLILLVTKNGDLVSRQEIVQHLWGDDVFVDTDYGINTAVRKIRRALGDDPDEPRFVQTVTGKGYRFIASCSGIQISAGNGNGSKEIISPAERPARSISVEDISVRVPPARTAVAAVGSRTLVGVLAVIGVFLVLGSAWFLRPPLAATRITGAYQLSGDGKEKFPSLATDGSRVYFTEHSGQHWNVASISVAGGEVVSIHLPFPDAHFIALSPDKTELLVGEGKLWDQGQLWLVPLLGGSPHRMANVAAHDARWSADGQKFSYVKDDALYVAKGDGSDPRQLYAASDSHDWAWTPTWSPDGLRLRFEVFDMDAATSTLWEIDADGRNLHPVLPGWQTTPMQCCSAWTSSGRYYLFNAWSEINGASPISPVANLWAIRTKESVLHRSNPQPVQLTAGPVHFFTHAVSPDDTTIFALGTQRGAELMRYNIKARQSAPYRPGFSADNVNFSRDGQWMAYVKYPQGELWRSRADGSEALQLSFRPVVASAPRWSPDGQRISFCAQQAENKLKSFVVSLDGGPIQPLLPETPDGIDPSWSPDGNSVLFGPQEPSSGRQLSIIDLRTRRVSAVPGSSGLLRPNWSPTGRYLAAVRADHGNLVLFDFKAGKWTTLELRTSNWPVWSGDGKYIYFVGDQPSPGIWRVSATTGKVEKVVDLDGFTAADSFGMWFSLTANDEPLMLREVGSGMEIYALHWDAP